MKLTDLNLGYFRVGDDLQARTGTNVFPKGALRGEESTKVIDLSGCGVGALVLDDFEIVD